jgi:AraC family transcriptional regulator
MPMVSHDCLDRTTYQPDLRPAEARSDDAQPASAPRAGARSLSERGRRAALCFDAARILEGICRAGGPEHARTAVLQLVTLLTSAAAPRSAAARGGLAPWQMRKLDHYLSEHLTRPMRLDELANQVSLSVSYFCRAFKESFRNTPHEYIIRLRLERAQKMMLATAEPLTQIALDCGFADQSHFSKLFRRALGEPPSAWRRRNLTAAQARAKPPRRGTPAGMTPDLASV